MRTRPMLVYTMPWVCRKRRSSCWNSLPGSCSGADGSRAARRIASSDLRGISSLVLWTEQADWDLYEERKGRNRFYRSATFYAAHAIIDLMINTAFETLDIIQTVFGDPDTIKDVQHFQSGHGRGGFVVIRTVKPAPAP